MTHCSNKATLFYYSVLCSCINTETIFLLGLAARLAVQAGAAGIIVSNHGARQLDYVPSTIMALEEVGDLLLKIVVLCGSCYFFFVWKFCWELLYTF